MSGFRNQRMVLPSRAGRLSDGLPRHVATEDAGAGRPGVDPKQKWAVAFPDLDRAGLAEATKTYLRSLHFKVTDAVVPPVPVAVVKRHPLTEADVLGLRAMLYMALASSSRRSPAESEALAKRALEDSFQQDPASFWAHQVNYAYFETLPESADSTAGHSATK